jgi:hypothetical protein
VKEWDKFEKFTDNLLSRHSPDLPLDTLWLHVVNPPTAHQGHGRQRWNQSGDGASSLVRLCLERCRPVKLAILSEAKTTPVELRGLGREIDLTRLTTLHLSGLVLRGGFAHHIGASGCPRLQHVQLNDCDLAFTELLLSPTLTSLSVFYSTYYVHRRRPGSVAPTRIHCVRYLDWWHFKVPALLKKLPLFIFGGSFKSAALSGVGNVITNIFLKCRL